MQLPVMATFLKMFLFISTYVSSKSPSSIIYLSSIMYIQFSSKGRDMAWGSGLGALKGCSLNQDGARHLTLSHTPPHSASQRHSDPSPKFPCLVLSCHPIWAPEQSLLLGQQSDFSRRLEKRSVCLQARVTWSCRRHRTDQERALPV